MSVSFSPGAGLIIVGVFLVLLLIPGGSEIISDLLEKQVRSIWRKSTKFSLIAIGVFLIIVGLVMILQDVKIPQLISEPSPTSIFSQTITPFLTSTETSTPTLILSSTPTSSVTPSSTPILSPTKTFVPTPTIHPRWQYWHDLGLAYYVAGKYEQMLDALVLAADLAPSNTDWITTIGEQLHGKREYSIAESVLRIVRTHNGADRLAIYWLAWSLYEQQKYDDARGHFNLCVQAYTGETYFTARCHAGLGFTWKAEKNFAQARHELEISLELLPGQADVLKAVAELP